MSMYSSPLHPAIHAPPQDQTAIIVRKLQILLPEGEFFLDVDCLDDIAKSQTRKPILGPLVIMRLRPVQLWWMGTLPCSSQVEP